MFRRALASVPLKEAKEQQSQRSGRVMSAMMQALRRSVGPDRVLRAFNVSSCCRHPIRILRA